MKTLTQRETGLVSGAGTDEEDQKIYAWDMKQQMKGKTPAQIARLPGFRGTNQYGGISFERNGMKITIGPGSFTHNTNPPQTVPSFGIEIAVPIN